MKRTTPQTLVSIVDKPPITGAFAWPAGLNEVDAADQRLFASRPDLIEIIRRAAPADCWPGEPDSRLVVYVQRNGEKRIVLADRAGERGAA